jgi:hypothetical protein
MAPLGEHHRLKVTYRGGRAVIVTGPATGKQYRFSGIARLQLVHPSDAVALIRNPLFRIEGIAVVPASDGASARDDEGGNA